MYPYLSILLKAIFTPICAKLFFFFFFFIMACARIIDRRQACKCQNSGDYNRDCLLQYWMLSKTGEIRRDESCLDYSGSDVILYPCHGSKGNQQWIYSPQVMDCL